MGYGYNNNNNYRGYNPGGYRRSSYNLSGKKRRNRRRLKNRIIIVATGVVIAALIIALFSSIFSCICSSGEDKGNTVDTSTINTAATKASAKKVSKEDTITFNEPKIKDEDKDSKGVLTNDIFVWNKTAFELFYGSQERAQSYAETVNSLKKDLGKDITVYNMLVPNHTEMGLPSRLKSGEDGAVTNSQAEYIKTAYLKLDKSIVFVNPYNKLSEHCNDYIYFNSDHHWTGLGAYYAYTAFTEAANQKALSLKDCNEKKIDGFTGSFTQMTSETLRSDSVHYWDFPYEVKDTVTDGNGNTNEYNNCYYIYAAPGSYTYGVFLYGDNPLEVLKSSCKTASEDKIAIVHESYGNAIVPYFTYNYKEVYSIDFRSWSGNLKTFCKQNKIKNVLFVNGVMSSATGLQVDAMSKLTE